MRWATLLSAGLTLAALAAAHFIESPAWIHALTLSLGGLGLTLALIAALILRRLSQDWALILGTTLGLAATLSRTMLLQKLLVAPAAARPIDVAEIFLGASSVAWALLALVWSVHGLAAIVIARGKRTQNILRLVAAGAGISLALYALTPLWHLLGLGIDHWTAVGLLGLALLAYGVEVLYRRFQSAG